jgi:hypothetical protein
LSGVAATAKLVRALKLSSENAATNHPPVAATAKLVREGWTITL